MAAIEVGQMTGLDYALHYLANFLAPAGASTDDAIVGGALALILAMPSLLAAAPPVFGDWGFDATGMDPAVKPGEDFFKYANGAWDRRTVIPDDRSMYGVDLELSDAAERHVREILEAEAGAGPGPAARDAKKIHDAYVAFMDEARAETLSASPIASDLAAVRAAKTRADLAAVMGRERTNFPVDVFELGIFEDLKSPDRYAVYLGQADLGLPDRDYYLEPGFAAKKSAYDAYVAQVLTLVNWPDAARAAKAVVDYETGLAALNWTRAEQRNPDKMYNPMTRAQLARAAPDFPWAAYLDASGLSGVQRVVVMENTAIPKLAARFGAEPLKTLKAWAAFRLSDAAAPYLGQRLDQARFAFRDKLLNGQTVEQARWKRAVRFVNRGMGQAVGRVYVARYFPPEAKTKIDTLVGELRVALGRRIDALDWMSAETKAKAHAKLARFTVKIAYPDRWRDYADLNVSGTDLVGDARAFRAFEWNRQVKRLNGPVDRTEWDMTPQTVDAYYNPAENEIVFPAGILAPPYFDPNADPAANYGGIGAVIGHEMTHAFDDEGRKFDGAGKLSDWWTKADSEGFDARARRLNAQYDTYSPFPGVHVKGEQTTGENIADLGGLLIALDAYHISLGAKPAPIVGGLNGDQRFFLAYAQSWRDKRREDAVRDQLVGDVHSPEIYRVNGVLRNVDSWYPAFDVQDGQALFLAPKDRVRIW